MRAGYRVKVGHEVVDEMLIWSDLQSLGFAGRSVVTRAVRDAPPLTGRPNKGGPHGSRP